MNQLHFGQAINDALKFIVVVLSAVSTRVLFVLSAEDLKQQQLRRRKVGRRLKDGSLGRRAGRVRQVGFQSKSLYKCIQASQISYKDMDGLCLYCVRKYVNLLIQSESDN